MTRMINNPILGKGNGIAPDYAYVLSLGQSILFQDLFTAEGVTLNNSTPAFDTAGNGWQGGEANLYTITSGSAQSPNNQTARISVDPEESDVVFTITLDPNASDTEWFQSTWFRANAELGGGGTTDAWYVTNTKSSSPTQGNVALYDFVSGSATLRASAPVGNNPQDTYTLTITLSGDSISVNILESDGSDETLNYTSSHAETNTIFGFAQTAKPFIRIDEFKIEAN